MGSSSRLDSARLTVWSCLFVALVAWMLQKYREIGVRTIHQSYFPAGCRWAVVDDARANVTHPMEESHRSYVWRKRVYEFFPTEATEGIEATNARLDNGSKAGWNRFTPPPVCTVAGHSVDARTRLKAPITGTTDHSKRNDSYRIIQNLWYCRGSFYKLVDPGHPETGAPVPLSSNINLYTIAVENLTAFIQNTKSARYVGGETVLIDYSYFVHPTAIGHWLEYLLPVMSARRLEGLDREPPRMVLVMHLKRSFVFEWVRAAFGAALGGDSGGDVGRLQGTSDNTLPFPLIFQAETSSVWNQIGQRLEGVGDDEWVCFENVLVAKDVIDDGPRTAFMDEGGERDARQFRKRMWKMYGVSIDERSGVNGLVLHEDAKKNSTTAKNNRITLLHKSANRRILNKAPFRSMLAEFGHVTEVELTDSVSMASQIQIMANTDILVSTHTSGLANAMFLPPGALVVELRHRNFLESMERTFELQIKSLKDVRWVGWKAMEIAYLHEEDERKFRAWGDSCDVDECVEAHTLVDIVVDIDAVRRIIAEAM